MAEIQVQEFSLVGNQEIAKQHAETVAQADKLRATQREAEEELNRKIDLLHEQRRAVESHTWDEISRMWDKGNLREYAKQIKLKEQFEKNLPEVTKKYGVFDYKCSTNGDTIVVDRSVVIKFGTYHVDFFKSEGFSCWHVETHDDIVKVSEFLNTEFDARADAAVLKEATAYGYEVAKQTKLGNNHIFLVTKGSDDWVVKAYKVGLEYREGTPSVSVRCLENKYYKHEKSATNKYIEWGGN